MSVKLSKGHHRTLVISERPWFYFLRNIGLNPDVFFVVNRCSDSVAFGNEIMPVITFLNITYHQCHWLVSWDIWIWAPFLPALNAHSRSDIKDVCSYLKFIIGYQYLQNHQIWVWDSLFLLGIHPQQLAHTLFCSLEPSLVSKQLWMTSGVSVSLIVISQHIKNTLYTSYNVPSSSGMQFLAIYFSV